LIKPLFLDDLWAEFESIRTNKAKLNEFHLRLSKMKFLDPACGCGNFLVVTYRELRLLELAILQQRFGTDRVLVELEDVALLNVDMMCGIEYEEFPARIAEVAMWLMDHQMNLKMSMEFGQYFARLPLTKSARIVNANALRIDWEEVVSKDELSYILGNPPFLGTAYQNNEQKEDLAGIFSDLKSFGMLDYVACWYAKAAKYIQSTQIKVALVSTNSIIQGEQASVLWGYLFTKYKVSIHFAHQTFKWKNDARGNAAVHVVIIGFGIQTPKKRFIYEYSDLTSEPIVFEAKNINQYLIDAKEVVLTPRTNPILDVPKIGVGSALLDGGNLILNESEKAEILKKEPDLSKYIKPLWSADEFINSKIKWCFWLKDITPVEISKSTILKERISNIREFRLQSSRPKTKEMAQYPYLFGEQRQPVSSFLLIPKVSSENRQYIPIGYMTKDDIITDKVFALPNATLYQFGVLNSIMHMTWVKYTCGRLKSDISYSNTVVYNNYPWPESSSEKQKEAINKAAQKVLDVRLEFEHSSLGQLYSKLTMPPALVKAHNELDKAVDLAYRPQPFTSDANRMEFLFELYEKYTAGLFAHRQAQGKRGKKGKK
jgi:hypothetical protein